ncbi:hypothetical protein AVEN_145248-1 [Araneus ventricosus]|uniref:Uncharacterized protein n=1 Tax=Araneus ventricosus TaxID=182803 RepID=A0A4Y2VQX1_ARAVE|nr:hypothetical protein AVEN_145248-1 [Araneus ventricosus]
MHILTSSWNQMSADMIRNCFTWGGFCETLDKNLSIVIEPPESMLEEEYEKWMSIHEDIPVVTTLTDVKICQVVCEYDQAINVDDSNRAEHVEETSSKHRNEAIT